MRRVCQQMSAWFTPLNICWRRVDRNATPLPPDVSCHDLAQECPFLRENELVLLGEIEIGHAVAVRAQPRPVALIGCETLERDQRKGDVVGALVRHPVAEEIAAAFRDDGEPVFRVLLEQRALEGVELVTDEDGDGHGCTPMLIGAVIASAAKQSIPPLAARWIASAFAKATADKSSLRSLAQTLRVCRRQ